MDVLHHLAFGFSVILHPQTLLSCLIGITMGTLIGVLPGIGAGAAISILLPISFKMTPVSSLVMLSGIFYGAMYGGSTTSILVNVPGEAASVMTCLDGYQMARQGRAGPALGIAAFSSFIAGTFSIIMIMLVAPPLAEAALKFGYPEFLGIILLGITMVSYLARGSKIKALMIAVLGMIVATIGQDPIRGTERFTYGRLTLMDGVGLVPVIMGMFGIPEILENIETSLKQEVYQTKIKGLLPTRQDWKESGGPIARGTVLGFFLGLLPGVGAMIPTFISYNQKLKKYLEGSGFEVVGAAGLGFAANADINRVSPEEAYRFLKKTGQAFRGAEGIIVPCANWPTSLVAPQVEVDLGIPVVTSNLAKIWGALRALEIKEPIRNHGRLLEEKLG